MCKQDTESVKVAPESVLISNRGNLEGTHLTRFSPGGGYLRTPMKTIYEHLFAVFYQHVVAKCTPPLKKFFLQFFFSKRLKFHSEISPTYLDILREVAKLTVLA